LHFVDAVTGREIYYESDRPALRVMATIFAFWEPRGAVLPYIGLCMQTWPTAFKGHEVVVLDYSTLPQYLGDAPYPMAALRQLSLPIQKDAIMVATLLKHGGVFIDADTLAVGDITPLVDRLRDTEVVMFGSHMAAVAARANARVLDRWYAGIHDKIAALGSTSNPPGDVPWDFAGKSVLTAAIEGVIGTRADEAVASAVAEAAVRWLERQASTRGRRLARLANTVAARWRAVRFRAVGRPYLTTLDRTAHAFVPELLYYGETGRDVVEVYRRYWFESDAGVDTALRHGQTLIALHNSWTPQWYRELSEEAVLAHPCLLSRTLNRLLSR
jgi:hypothetical protein